MSKYFTIWLGPEMDNFHKKCIKSWEKQGIKYKVYKLEDFQKNIHYKIIKKLVYKKKFCFASDICRYIVLIEKGGIYLDCDIELIKLPPTRLETFELQIAKESNEYLSNGYMDSKKGSNFVKKLLKVSLINYNKSVFITGPKLLTKLYNNECPEEVNILPKESFTPYNPYSKDHYNILMFESIKSNTFGIHHYIKPPRKKWSYSIIDKIKLKLHELVK